MKNAEYVLILMVIVYYCCFYYYYPVTLGHYKLACVLAVLREIQYLYVGCLTTVKAD